MRPSLLLVSFIFSLSLLQNLNAVNYYVSSKGSDSNNGSLPTLPFRSLQKAANLTLPGDTVFVMNGTYTNSCPTCDVLQINRSGTPAAYITFKAYRDHRPKIKFNSWQGIKVFGASYIHIEGFEIEGNNSGITLAYAENEKGNTNNSTTSGNGIYIENKGSTFSHHIEMVNNTIHDCGGHGIGSHWADYITIEKNTIFNNAWYSPLGCSGISLYQNKSSDNNTGFRIFISGNKIYNNQMFIPFFYNNKIEDGNGMIIDDGRNTQNGSPHGKYAGKIRIENNVVFDNGGKGIHAYLSDNIEVVNNTCYQNCKSAEVKDGELSAYACSNVTFHNNATYSRNDARANHDGDGSSTNITFSNNSFFNYDKSKKITQGENAILEDPGFVNPSTSPTTSDFHLKATSPLINKGTLALSAKKDFDNVSRPQESLPEIGAYEFKSNVITPLNTPPTVTITTPANNSVFTGVRTITINANALDKEGVINKVEFFRDTLKIGEDSVSPFKLDFTTKVSGTYKIHAKATDNEGASAISQVVSFIIKDSIVLKKDPQITITSPSDSSDFISGTDLTIKVNATDEDGIISKVEFFSDNENIGEVHTDPFSFTMKNLKSGTILVTAVATDDQGLTDTSFAITVNVKDPVLTDTTDIPSDTLTNNPADTITIDPDTANNTTCIEKSVPSATQWRVMNSWNDQTNGSGVSNDEKGLKVSHRAWGNNNLLLLESGTSINVVAGRQYKISFKYKDDDLNSLINLEAGFAKSFDSYNIAFSQSLVSAGSTFSADAFLDYSLTIIANESGNIYLCFNMNWKGQPGQLTESYFKDISVCEVSTENDPHSAMARSVSLYPNPSSSFPSLQLSEKNDENYTVNLYDSQGLLLFTQEKSSIEISDRSFEDLPPGNYIIEVIFSVKVERLRWTKL